MPHRKEAGLLVLTNVFFPGWRATVDGSETKIYRVNGLVRGEFLKEGRHQVVFTYFPSSFLFELMLFSAAAFVCIGLLLVQHDPRVSMSSGQ